MRNIKSIWTKELEMPDQTISDAALITEQQAGNTKGGNCNDE